MSSIEDEVEFRTLRTGATFTYLDERYVKTGEWTGCEANTNATRRCDGARVAFLPTTRVTPR